MNPADEALALESLTDCWYEAIFYSGELFWIRTAWSGREFDVGVC